jgi:hypothetical protein
MKVRTEGFAGYKETAILRQEPTDCRPTDSWNDLVNRDKIEGLRAVPTRVRNRASIKSED